MLQNSGRRIALISLAEQPPTGDADGGFLEGMDLGSMTIYHIPPSLPAFQKDIEARTATEAALHTILTSDPVDLTLDRIEHDFSRAAD